MVAGEDGLRLVLRQLILLDLGGVEHVLTTFVVAGIHRLFPVLDAGGEVVGRLGVEIVNIRLHGEVQERPPGIFILGAIKHHQVIGTQHRTAVDTHRVDGRRPLEVRIVLQVRNPIVGRMPPHAHLVVLDHTGRRCADGIADAIFDQIDHEGQCIHARFAVEQELFVIGIDELAAGLGQHDMEEVDRVLLAAVVAQHRAVDAVVRVRKRRRCFFELVPGVRGLGRAIGIHQPGPIEQLVAHVQVVDEDVQRHGNQFAVPMRVFPRQR